MMQKDSAFRGDRGGLVEIDTKAVNEAGEFEGYGSVFGVMDQGQDVVMPGAFAASLSAYEYHAPATTLPESAEFLGLLVVLRHFIDAGVIAAVVLVNATVGFVQEGKAEQAMSALREMLSATAKVLRDGQRVTVPVAETTPPENSPPPTMTAAIEVKV